MINLLARSIDLEYNHLSKANQLKAEAPAHVALKEHYTIIRYQTPPSVCSQVTVVSLQAFLPESLPPVTVIPEDTLEVQLSWTTFLESKSRLLWNQCMATPSRELSLAPSTHPSSEGMKTRSSLLATTGAILACLWSF